jgi:hypothetical protein
MDAARFVADDKNDIWDLVESGLDLAYFSITASSFFLTVWRMDAPLRAPMDGFTACQEKRRRGDRKMLHGTGI